MFFICTSFIPIIILIAYILSITIVPICLYFLFIKYCKFLSQLIKPMFIVTLCINVMCIPSCSFIQFILLFSIWYHLLNYVIRISWLSIHSYPHWGQHTHSVSSLPGTRQYIYLVDLGSNLMHALGLWYIVARVFTTCGCDFGWWTTSIVTSSTILMIMHGSCLDTRLSTLMIIHDISHCDLSVFFLALVIYWSTYAMHLLIQLY